MRKPIAWAGFDPGKKGAFAILPQNGDIFFLDWPQTDTYGEIFDKISQARLEFNIRLCIIEKVASMSGQGVKSVWSFGQNYGACCMMLTALNIKYLKLVPTAWQKGLVTKTDGPDPKARVKNVATALFQRDMFYGPKGGYKDGRGDSALMAYKAKMIDTGVME